MALKNINELLSVAGLQGDELLVVSQNGVARKMTITDWMSMLPPDLIKSQIFAFNSTTAYENFKRDFPNAIKTGDVIMIRSNTAYDISQRTASNTDSHIVTTLEAVLHVHVNAQQQADVTNSSIYYAYQDGRTILVHAGRAVCTVDQCTLTSMSAVGIAWEPDDQAFYGVLYSLNNNVGTLRTQRLS